MHITLTLSLLVSSWPMVVSSTWPDRAWRTRTAAQTLPALETRAPHCRDCIHEAALHAEIDGGDDSFPPHLRIALVSHPDFIRTRQQQHSGDDFASLELVSRPHSHSASDIHLKYIPWHGKRSPTGRF